MKLFDQRTLIKDYEDGSVLDLTPEMLDKLDAMLTAHGLDHAFSLPMLDDFDAVPEAQAAMFYYEDDMTTVFLVLALWLKTERQMTDERILKAMQAMIDKSAE